MTDDRRRPDPMWFRVLDRFGLPTLYSVAAGALVIWLVRGVVHDNRAVLERLAASSEATVAVLRDLERTEERHARAVEATWAPVRIPRSATVVSRTNPQGETP